MSQQQLFTPGARPIAAGLAPAPPRPRDHAQVAVALWQFVRPGEEPDPLAIDYLVAALDTARAEGLAGLRELVIDLRWRAWCVARQKEERERG